jgi:hypothetical protein
MTHIVGLWSSSAKRGSASGLWVAGALRAQIEDCIMAGTYVLDSSKVGQAIDTAGTLRQISYDAPPTAWERLSFNKAVGSPEYGLPTSGAFCLIDVLADGSLNTIYNLDIFSNGGFTPGTISTLSIPFAQLVLQCCPVGASFTVTTA